MIGPSSGTFSAPYTSISLKKDVMAEVVITRIGSWVNPNGMLDFQIQRVATAKSNPADVKVQLYVVDDDKCG